MRMRSFRQRGLAVILALAISSAMLAAEPAEHPRGLASVLQKFAEEAAYRVEAYFGGQEIKAQRLEKPGPNGEPAISLHFKSPKENAGANVSWTFAPTVLDGESFTVQIQTPDGAIPYVRCEFHDERGKRICRNTYFSFNAPAWKPVKFGLGREHGAPNSDPPAPEPGQKVAKIVLQFCGKAGKDYRVLISEFDRVTPRAPKAGKKITPVHLATQPSIPPTISSGETALWLDAERAHTFAGARVAGLWLSPKGAKGGGGPGPYPRFNCVDAEGKNVTFIGSDPGVKAGVEKSGDDRIAVTYTKDNSAFKLTWIAGRDTLRCDVSVVSEANLKLASVGVPRIFGAAIAKGDYGIATTGHLMLPFKEKQLQEYKRRGNTEKPIPNFSSARIGERILFYRPLTPSQQIFLTVESDENTAGVWFGGELLFRPPDFKNPATKLCHTSLSWQIEWAGDVNKDGTVDWVDAAIAFRDRYMTPNKDKDALLRDSYLVYHGIPGDTYEQLTGVIEKLDFATGLWWVKGAMVTGGEPGSEAHPYKVAPDPKRGDKAAFKERIAATGSRVGIYYGHDYIDLTDGDWPPELIKMAADGSNHKYYKFRDRQLYYKDNVRGLASGLLKDHYEKIIATCKLTPGDPVMLDTFTAYGRPGYHPDFPATPGVETQAKHEIARWLKYDKKLSIAGEGIVEGTQDVVDFGAIVESFNELVRSRGWQDPAWIPLTSVIYNGRTYFGCSWYEFRLGDPNWAASLLLGAHLWEWSTGHYPQGMYESIARIFFKQNLIWSRNADAAVMDLDREGTGFKIRYDNGNTLWVDPDKKTWKFEEKGIVYDGFTPFNNKGVMAILKQGDFDLTLPVTDMLEIIPSQPHRDKLDVKIEKTADGKIRVHGNFSKIPWKMKWYHKPEGAKTDVMDTRDVEPVLMLRKMKG